MTEDLLAIPLTAFERQLISGLRSIAASPLRARLLAMFDGLVRIGQEPCCVESQADGVPCASVHGQCDACAAVHETIHALAETHFPIGLAFGTLPAAPRGLSPAATPQKT
jgi:hypothetical protein